MTTQPPSWGSPRSARREDAPAWPSQPLGASPVRYAQAGVEDVPGPGGGRRDWRILVMTSAIAVLVVVGVLVYVVGGSAARSPRARLDSALVATDSAVTADLAIDVDASFDGLSFSVTANGAVDFANKSISLQMSTLGQTFAFVETDDVLYANLGKLVSTQFPGKTWLRMPVSALADEGDSQMLVTSDPQALASELVKLGATITPTGTTTIDGMQDQGYKVQLTLAELEAHASDLPASLRSLLTTAKKVSTTATVSATMFVDPSGQLQAADVALTMQATGHPVTASVDLTMSHFGTASVAPAPPITQTVTYQQWKGSLGSSSLPFTLPSGTQAS